jgi:ABC-type antimicrobial peptide transport system permease subunit
VFSGLALALAAVGLYGVMAYSVSQRTSEMGIRMALGADRARVMRLVMRDGLRLAAVGGLLGIAGAYVFARMAETLLFGVSPTDPVSFALACGFLALVALAAGYLPARRAARVNPLLALRWE